MPIQKLPGTQIEVDITQPGVADRILTPIFMGGGLVLSQVSSLLGLEMHTVQNWVKRGFVPNPQHKRYSKKHFCRIAIINFLKDAMPLDRIDALLSFITNQLEIENDDMIDDSLLYSYFVSAVGQLHNGDNPELYESLVFQLLEDYNEPCPGLKRRLFKVLIIMLVAFHSTVYKNKTEQLLLGIYT